MSNVSLMHQLACRFLYNKDSTQTELGSWLYSTHLHLFNWTGTDPVSCDINGVVYF